MHQIPPLGPPIVPTTCPACGSTDLSTTSKVVSDASYWRCGACGEIWNALRRKDTSRWYTR